MMVSNGIVVEISAMLKFRLTYVPAAVAGGHWVVVVIW
jgi:hypothetical protein